MKLQKERLPVFLGRSLVSSVCAASPEGVARAVCDAAMARRPKARYCMPAKARIRLIMTHLPTSWRDWLIRQALRRVEKR